MGAHCLGTLLIAMTILNVTSFASAKTASVVVTAEMRANAMRNVERYDWARRERDLLIRRVEPWMALSEEAIWKLLPSQDMPRDSAVSRGDGCPNCGKEHYKAPYQPSRWHYDVLNKPWKIQCRNCKVWLPGNDFAAYYQSALDDQHRFRFGAGDAAYLEADINGFVDDGAGVVVGEAKFFAAAFYAFRVWRAALDAAEDLATLYTLTENPAYAHKAAVILDRAADLYPEMDFRPHFERGMEASTGGSGDGRVQGRIWETWTAEKLSRAYDYIYDAMIHDQQLATFAQDMSRRYRTGDKSSPRKIAEHIERNLLLEFVKSIKGRQIAGNAGMHQVSMAVTAIALDDPVQTPQLLDWLFEPTRPLQGGAVRAGGDVPLVMLQRLCREGLSDESAFGYASIPARSFVKVADLLRQYEGYTRHDIYRDYPKFRNAFTLGDAIRIADTYTPNWGDSNKCGNSVGGAGVMLSTSDLVSGFRAYGSEAIARQIEKSVGGDLDRIHGEIYDADPQAIVDQIRAHLASPSGPLRSYNSGGYGLSILHAPQREHPRGIGLYYGRTAGHGHKDRLAISILAHDIAMCPDMGYPLYATVNAERMGWVSHTVSHNTVMVDDRTQAGSWSGKTRLFAQEGSVHVADVDGDPTVYDDVQTYRRAVVQIDVDEKESYFLDLFMVRGGRVHRLIQNGNGPELELEGVTLHEQPTGTLAGPDVEYAEAYDGQVDSRDYRGSGLQFLKRVSRGQPNDPAGAFIADWSLVETWRRMPDEWEAHLRLHNLCPVDEIAVADGFPPQFNGAPERLRYLHRIRRGDDLTSLFVTLLDPYGRVPNVTSAQLLEHVATGDVFAAAVEVQLADGRRDVILFRDTPGSMDAGGIQLDGRIGFVRFEGGGIREQVMIDATRLTVGDDSLTLPPAITGTIQGFNDTDPVDIRLQLSHPLPQRDDLIGRYIIIDNRERSDASYRIEKVYDAHTIGLGSQSLVERLVDPMDYAKGVIHNVSQGDAYRITLSQGTVTMGMGRMNKTFNIWAAGDAHVGTDKRIGNRRSLAEAIEQSEGEGGFNWDIMIDVGDLSGNQKSPDDEEGREVVEQYAALKHHRREQVYNLAGNHDASGPNEPTQWWFRKYGDPTGEHTEYSGVDPARRPYPVQGTWERYSFTFGNVLVLMMSDRNDGGPPVGRGEKGGYPAGAVTGETFDWWVQQVESNRDKIIISVHHHMLKETTVASGEWEGFGERDRYGRYKKGFHGYFPDGGPMGASYLYWVDGNPDAQAFERYLEAHPGAIDLWIGGHTHTHPDDTTGGRSHIERKWDVTFLNTCALTRYHVRTIPMSRLLTLTQGSDELLIRCYLHSDDHAPRGWYDKAQRTVPLRHPFVHPDR